MKGCSSSLLARRVSESLVGSISSLSDSDGDAGRGNGGTRRDANEEGNEAEVLLMEIDTGKRNESDAAGEMEERERTEFEPRPRPRGADGSSTAWTSSSCPRKESRSTSIQYQREKRHQKEEHIPDKRTTGMREGSTFSTSNVPFCSLHCSIPATLGESVRGDGEEEEEKDVEEKEEERGTVGENVAKELDIRGREAATTVLLMIFREGTADETDNEDDAANKRSEGLS